MEILEEREKIDQLKAELEQERLKYKPNYNQEEANKIINGMRQEYKDTIAELTQELKRFQWQPIRTAPRDGRELWGFGEGQQFVVNFEDDYWCNVCGFNTTHWMPLPSPPDHTPESGAMEEP